MITLSGLITSIQVINDGEFAGKVAYRAFPVSAAPDLPFICVRETESDNFTADNRVWQKRQYVDIELYSAQKDVESENALEDMFAEKEIIWDKSEEYIESEEMLEVIYEVII